MKPDSRDLLLTPRDARPRARSIGVLRPSTLDSAGSIDGARVLAWLLLVGLALAFVGLIFTPWQQSVSGSGRVVAYTPIERQQAIEAPISGRVSRWLVQEGDHVDAGELLVELSDNDPEILARLRRERDAIQAQADAAELQIAINQAKIDSLEGVRTAAVLGAGLKRQIADDRRDAAEEALEAAEAARKTAALNLERQRALHEKGLASTRARELAELELETTESALGRAKASLRAAKREVKAMEADRDKTDGDSRAKVEDARASLQKAKADKAKAEGELAKLDVRLTRQQTMQVTAPRPGSVFRVTAKQGGEMVKEGDELLVLVPDTGARAVELWVDGNDAPLITPGRHVRLQFEGWPAVQFVGWPSVAVGTFPGEVAFVDATDDGQGRFRVVVVPDGDEPWPEARYLRQGVRANGWVLLNQVSLGYELWRQFNGFPPAVGAPKVKAAKPTPKRAKK
ncbi:MAG: HlyD family efflux transporter periplasmic adaptor subunit [Myxococcales bacterium]|nr:HlyD family efflux transporter periplasmic adaptor subunit [Myxococcales bacterium]